VIQKEPVFEDVVSLAPFEGLALKKSGNFGFIDINIDLELVSADMREKIEADQYRIRQIIEYETGKMTWLELRNPEGKLKLKFRLINSINSAVSGARIRNLYFTHFTMQ